MSDQNAQRLTEAEEIDLLRQNHQLSVRVRALEAILARRSSRANPQPATTDEQLSTVRADLHHALNTRIPTLEDQLRRANETIRVLRLQNNEMGRHTLPSDTNCKSPPPTSDDQGAKDLHSKVEGKGKGRPASPVRRRSMPSKRVHGSRTMGNLSMPPALPASLASGTKKVHFSETLEDHSCSVLKENNRRKPTSVLKDSSRTPNVRGIIQTSLVNKGQTDLFVARGPGKAQLSVFDPDGQLVKKLIPKPIEGVISSIGDFDMDDQGNLYVIDNGNQNVIGSGLTFFKMVACPSAADSKAKLNLHYQLDGAFNRNFRRCIEKVAPESVVCFGERILVTSDVHGTNGQQRLFEFDQRGVLRRVIADHHILQAPRSLRLSSCDGEPVALVMDEITPDYDDTKRISALKCFRMRDGRYMGLFQLPFECYAFEFYTKDIVFFAVPGSKPRIAAQQVSRWPDASKNKEGDIVPLAHVSLTDCVDSVPDIRGLSFGPDDCVYAGVLGSQGSTVAKFTPSNCEDSGFSQSTFVAPVSDNPAPFRWIRLAETNDRWEASRFRP